MRERLSRLASSLARVALAVGLLAGPGEVAGQGPAPRTVSAEVFAGGELERYLRVLQLTGQAELYPWSVRGLSVHEVERIAPSDSAHPWAARVSFRDADDGAVRLHWIQPEVHAIYNSAFPYGRNDGMVWAGRGLTTFARLGFAAKAGPVSLVVAPEAFWTQNSAFELEPNGQKDIFRFGDWSNPFTIDAPQRFGEEAFGLVSPGQSTLRADVAGLSIGVSTANQQWGPAETLPLLLGTEAGGFPHVFLGTARPANVWVGRIHGRLVWGRLDASEYSHSRFAERRRFAPALVATFAPRWVQGLEVGFGRLFHMRWPEEGVELQSALAPFEGFLKLRIGKVDINDPRPENQMASVFARWAHPRSGFELFGEFIREDHSPNLRDLILEPDHISGYSLGFQKGWPQDDQRVLLLRGELLNARISHLQRARHQVLLYRHHQFVQGHTQRGQLLGSRAGAGGAGSLLAADYYHPAGRWTVEWTREERQDARTLRTRDALHGVGGQALIFAGPFEVGVRVQSLWRTGEPPAPVQAGLNSELVLRARM